MKSIYVLFLGVIIVFSSCGENEIEKPDDSIYGYDYFPLEVGHTWEYQVDSVLIFQGGTDNIFSTSYIQETITELIAEEGDEKTYRMERSYRNDLSEPWQLQDIWQISISDSKATRTEENLRFIKMVFPATDGTKWDGNVFFDANKEFTVAANGVSIYQDWSYKIESLDLTKEYNGITYPNVMQVSHVDEESLISRRFSEEHYAQNVGLVERRMEIFDSQNGDTALDWLVRAEKGFQLHQTLRSFTTN